MTLNEQLVSLFCFIHKHLPFWAKEKLSCVLRNLRLSSIYNCAWCARFEITNLVQWNCPKNYSRPLMTWHEWEKNWAKHLILEVIINLIAMENLSLSLTLCSQLIQAVKSNFYLLMSSYFLTAQYHSHTHNATVYWLANRKDNTVQIWQNCVYRCVYRFGTR